jgi:hypothetical protein
LDAQGAQLFAAQISPAWPAAQSVATRQLPFAQPPARQSCPAAHWLSAVQAAQALLEQISPLLQSPAARQLPEIQLCPMQR